MEHPNRIPDLSPEGMEKARKVLWEKAREAALSCKACPLAATRTNVVFGEGNERSRLMFIGEGPGADEDAQGLPFVGRAGQLLTQILTAGGIDRKDVYITNIVKCRPPENRVPTPEETIACDHHLQTQIMLIDPAHNTARKHTREMDTQDERGHNQDQGHVVQLAGHRGNADVPPKLPSEERIHQRGEPETPDMDRHTGSQKSLGYGPGDRKYQPHQIRVEIRWKRTDLSTLG